MFDGRLEHFEDFKYKAKAVFLELGLDDITFGSYVDVTSAREKLIKAAASIVNCQSKRKLALHRVLTEEAHKGKPKVAMV